MGKYASVQIEAGQSPDELNFQSPRLKNEAIFMIINVI
jgi:hypothetical protein